MLQAGVTIIVAIVKVAEVFLLVMSVADASVNGNAICGIRHFEERPIAQSAMRMVRVSHRLLAVAAY